MGVVEKIETKTAKVKTYSYFCDFCGKKLIEDYLYDSKKCCVCERYVCDEHKLYDPRDHSDYAPCFCLECWKVGEPYRAKIEELENEIIKVEHSWYDLAEDKAREAMSRKNGE